MFNVGASDAGLFAKACDEMTARAIKLGPNPLKKKMSNTTNTTNATNTTNEEIGAKKGH